MVARKPMRRIDRRREQPWRGNGGVFHIHDFVLNQQHQFKAIEPIRP